MPPPVLFPNEIVISTNYFTVAQDWEVPIAGFFIISSHRLVRSILDLTNEESHEFIFLLRHVRKGLHNILEIKDVYLFQNEDTKHGFHFWIFPRHSWMEPFGRKVESVHPIMNYATNIQSLGSIIVHAKEKRNSEEFCEEVRRVVRIMRDYMNQTWKIH